MPTQLHIAEARAAIPGLSVLDHARLGRFTETIRLAEVSPDVLQSGLDEAHLNPNSTSQALRDGQSGDRPRMPGEIAVLGAARTIVASHIAWRVTMNPNLGGRMRLPSGELRAKIAGDEEFQVRNRAADLQPSEPPIFLRRQARIIGCTVLWIAGLPFTGQA